MGGDGTDARGTASSPSRRNASSASRSGPYLRTDDELREVLSTIENSLIENSLHLEDGGAREAPHARGEEPTDCNLGQSRR